MRDDEKTAEKLFVTISVIILLADVLLTIVLKFYQNLLMLDDCTWPNVTFNIKASLLFFTFFVFVRVFDVVGHKKFLNISIFTLIFVASKCYLI